MRQRTVVLGATGYLGRALVGALLARTPEAEVVGIRAVEDLDTLEVTLSADDVVFNCVGYYGGDRVKLEMANVVHSRHVAERAQAADCVLVHVSSFAAYDGLLVGRIDEETRPRPRSLYGHSKVKGEAAVLSIHPSARIARPAKLFGGDDPRERLSSLLGHLARGRPLPVPRRPALWANFIPVAEAAN